MEVLILYGLLIIFFLLFPLLVVLFAREMEPSLQPEHNNKISRGSVVATRIQQNICQCQCGVVWNVGNALCAFVGADVFYAQEIMSSETLLIA